MGILDFLLGKNKKEDEYHDPHDIISDSLKQKESKYSSPYIFLPTKITLLEFKQILHHDNIAFNEQKNNRIKCFVNIPIPVNDYSFKIIEKQMELITRFDIYEKIQMQTISSNDREDVFSIYDYFESCGWFKYLSGLENPTDDKWNTGKLIKSDGSYLLSKSSYDSTLEVKYNLDVIYDSTGELKEKVRKINVDLLGTYLNKMYTGIHTGGTKPSRFEMLKAINAYKIEYDFDYCSSIQYILDTYFFLEDYIELLTSKGFVCQKTVEGSYTAVNSVIDIPLPGYLKENIFAKVNIETRFSKNDETLFCQILSFKEIEHQILFFYFFRYHHQWVRHLDPSMSYVKSDGLLGIGISNGLSMRYDKNSITLMKKSAESYEKEVNDMRIKNTSDRSDGNSASIIRKDLADHFQKAFKVYSHFYKYNEPQKNAFFIETLRALFDYQLTFEDSAFNRDLSFLKLLSETGLLPSIDELLKSN